ncbi:NUDIX hydrolase [Amycolatopsis saalfeldensis]|uniref:ADP-ribose pyrophosphatase YjhB, NUDIX family n=1 Tax=Amycolatopsis saalfeldensis TaxID=394193 RepID=A0A1H8YMV4_9PSEU|nr:NUDIX hydrolase [Amycolatopsis saalfeldensis]SEP53372.1 ADP-ribose pyrophosphatase YjhB, NUDIX family [Amycolatopsis saalfeldensis]
MTAAPPTGSCHSKTKRCDHAAVGVLISSPAGLLVFERVRFPVGIAPVAGHVDQHGGPEQAARAEVAEEVGLTVTSLHLLTTAWRPNRCRRPTSDRAGHHWSIYRAEVSGQIRPSTKEVRAPRWLSPEPLQQHAHRTAAYAAGRLSEEQFIAEPGLEPVWVRFLHELQLVTLPDDTLNLIEKVL